MNIECLSNLVNQDMSIAKIANTLNISKTTVRYWLKVYNLKTRLSYKPEKQNHKICFKCNCEKHLDQFYKCKGGRYSYCKGCSTQLKQEQAQSFKKECITYKGSKCLSCGYCKCDSALEFHHIDPSKKDFAIANSPRIKLNDKIKEELDKCILLCANCHREIHLELFTIQDLIQVEGNDPSQRPQSRANSL